MNSPICELLDIEFPLVAFTHCRDVVVEVSKAGGLGVLGAAGFGPEELEIELKWIDDHIGGKPYGVDLIAPTSMAGADNLDVKALDEQVPNEHREFTSELLEKHDIDSSDVASYQRSTHAFLTSEGADNIIDVAFSHPIKLIANALGVPPRYMIDIAKQKGVVTAALVGAKEHAIKQVEAGVDVLVVAGTEAGGHCGEVSTMVLIPEVCQAVEAFEVPVLAAGGIVTGRQMAACMAMGAHGAWTGSVWLTCAEADTCEVIKDKFAKASSRETVRSKARTGKYSRQLRSTWTDAWDSEEAPAPLPMPLQSRVVEAPLAKVNKLAENGHEGAKQLATYWVGQGVGLMSSNQSAKSIVYDFMEDFLGASERMKQFYDE